MYLVDRLGDIQNILKAVLSCKLHELAVCFELLDGIVYLCGERTDLLKTERIDLGIQLACLNARKIRIVARAAEILGEQDVYYDEINGA